MEDGLIWSQEVVGSSPTTRTIYMTTEERNRAEEIVRRFPSWNRPMSTEESKLVDEYREIQLNELLDESYKNSFEKLGEICSNRSEKLNMTHPADIG